MLTKLTYPNLDIYIDLKEITYMERELRPNTLMMLPNEKDYYTKVALKNGKVIACTETPEFIMKLINDENTPKISPISKQEFLAENPFVGCP